jgi:uncharacterized protein YqgC (DUF456 family)
VCVFRFLGDPLLLLLLLFLCSFVCLVSSFVLGVWIIFLNAFLLVCGFLFLSKFFEDFFHVLFLLIDAVPISYPFLEQYTTLDLV